MRSPARLAREAVGLSLEDAAKRVRVQPDTVRRAERCGCSWALAMRLARLYGCRAELFLPHKLEGRETLRNPRLKKNGQADRQGATSGGMG